MQDMQQAFDDTVLKIQQSGGLAGVVHDALANNGFTATPVNSGNSLTHVQASISHSLSSINHTQAEINANIAAGQHWDQAGTHFNDAWDSLKSGYHGNGWNGIGSSLSDMFHEAWDAGINTLEGVSHSYMAAQDAHLAGQHANLAGNTAAIQINNALSGGVIVAQGSSGGVQNLTQVSFINNMANGSTIGQAIEEMLDNVNDLGNKGISMIASIV